MPPRAHEQSNGNLVNPPGVLRASDQRGWSLTSCHTTEREDLWLTEGLVDTGDCITIERQGAGAPESPLKAPAGLLRSPPGSGKELPTCPVCAAGKKQCSELI